MRGVLDLSAMIEELAGTLRIVSPLDVPVGRLDNCLVPLIYEEMSSIYGLSQALAEDGILSNLSIQADVVEVLAISAS